MNSKSPALVILAAGDGSRFKYKDPKPFIRVFGVPMVRYTLDYYLRELPEDSPVFVICRKHHAAQMRNALPAFVTVLTVPILTKGASDTLRAGINLTSLDPQIPLIVADCDNISVGVINQFCKDTTENALGVFYEPAGLGCYCYVKIDENKDVIQIAEKEAVSDLAGCGIYCFSSISTMLQVQVQTPTLGELYLSGMFAKLKHTKVILTNAFHCLGTPVQLEQYLQQKHPLPPLTKLRFIFDLDGTLVDEEPAYDDPHPRVNMVQMALELQNWGHTIIVHTARRMRTHQGDVDAVEDDIGNITRATVADLLGPSVEVVFGKPWGDAYIDDRGIGLASARDLGLTELTYASRVFNHVVAHENIVIKTTEDSLIGESHWYQRTMGIGNIKYVPKILSVSVDAIRMAKINGCTAQELFISGLMTVSHIDLIIQSLSYFHSIKLTPDEIEEAKDHLHDNYGPKMITRGCIINKILKDQLETHVPKMGMIHGDPSLCNIIIEEVTQDLIFVDPKGKLGNITTVVGDTYYDFAKVYQSLIGYCEIIEGITVRAEYKRNLVNYFISKCNIEEDTLRFLASSLVFSMMSLHGPKHQDEFRLLAERLQSHI
jgi:hypothetical protein